MDRIAARFEQARQEGRACFINYICGGDPDYETSLAVCLELVKNGCDLLEIGMPFSDPLADGPTNQLAAQRALDAGATQEQMFQLAAAIRKETEIPIIFYTYYNLVNARGLEQFLDRCVEAGVDGVLTLDLPPEYAEEMVAESQKRGLKNIFIIAPTTPPERMEIIAKSATGFIYYVSREGVTGERDELASNIGEAVSEIRKHTDLPIGVGFGVSTAEHVRQLGALADGVIVGSTLVNCIARNLGNKEAILAALRDRMAELTKGLRR